MKKLLLLLFLVLTACGQKEGVEVRDAWIRAAPPGAKVMAAYLIIDNHGSQAIHLSSADSPAFGHVMLHNTVTEDGISRMVHEDSVEIGPGQILGFAPGGRHLMLMAPAAPIEPGDRIRLDLQFADGRVIGVDAVVRRDGQ